MPIFLIPVAAAGYAYYEKRKKLGKEGEEGNPDEEWNDQTVFSVAEVSNDGATQESSATDVFGRNGEKTLDNKSADSNDVPSWIADNSASQRGEEPLLSAIVSKQRSGFGKYSLHNSWERRRLVLEPSRVVYYHLDSSKPHGMMEINKGVSVETNVGADCEIILSTADIKWRVLFDTQLQRATWLSTLKDMGKAVREKKERDQAYRYRPLDGSATCIMEGGSDESFPQKPPSDENNEG
jgi:hypothetical protein